MIQTFSQRRRMVKRGMLTVTLTSRTLKYIMFHASLQSLIE